MSDLCRYKVNVRNITFRLDSNKYSYFSNSAKPTIFRLQKIAFMVTIFPMMNMIWLVDRFFWLIEYCNTYLFTWTNRFFFSPKKMEWKSWYIFAFRHRCVSRSFRNFAFDGKQWNEQSEKRREETEKAQVSKQQRDCNDMQDISFLPPVSMHVSCYKSAYQTHTHTQTYICIWSVCVYILNIT